MPPIDTRIEHVVVVMLENRSFDHMLGDLDIPDLDGLHGVGPIPAQIGGGSPTPGTPWVTDPDPGHGFADVMTQIFGVDNPPAGAPRLNNGFMLSYAQQLAHGAPANPKQGGAVMQCFKNGALPVSRTLAAEFVVCNRWHASVPGPTWPNRFFVHAGTSNGHVDMPSGLAEVARYLEGFRDLHTIYERFGAGGYSWNIYYSDFTFAWIFDSLRAYPEKFLRVDAFLDDAHNGHLPTYAFVEPAYFVDANDQHPPHDVWEGERFIAMVYDALRSGPRWEKTLLVVLWDEHGGFFDHRLPETTVAPYGERSTDPPFDFTLLGLRVPAFLVSPWVAPGRPDGQLRDHTSLLNFLMAYFQLPGTLGERVARANSFQRLFLPSARTDTRRTLSDLVAYRPAALPAVAATHPPNHEHAAHALLRHVEDRFPRQPSGQRVAADVSKLRAALERVNPREERLMGHWPGHGLSR